ncbi:4-hydroxybenzoate 3-monooxygenase [Pseudonocardia sp. KRD-184]|uniref:4-hydroxybenzoate 3-monooxygenase n=1 Tax=Pseudonocardia oceani TaxID=2792013 RepID=A0ABS6UCR5_9PSEU|nr:4-hydroxybenzoate 3-monooxygenase [Pseudonocardia oceani]MBW0088586.1 4-hydroxybenzoate 3-monooxygenase [Pseudonocardia oceani]MBW0094441.1 4-hydroxybenzoate 3-monooxygenase [Pseudonocardia oceani]MBW0108154.1 4-hydroxybenzoate 3-monooxygenase [Pseudonocardia oceani]MBW0119952.1 4-hydroxybenzoate 3-monooxygenase [Pseudonocardia oceani]MBW0130032.1 4-hydroxybenzoate 3-monooxygenase [Pseudonocardia oceani]
MRTQVGIVGAGPAGLLLSHLLARRGIDSVVLEARSREYVEKRVRAGVLEHPTVELLREVGLGERLDREGMAHEGVSLRFDGEEHRIDFADLTGRGIVVYGQQEVVKDLITARLADGGDVRFEVSGVQIDDVTTDPVIRFDGDDGGRDELRCDVVVGADGFHGVSRACVPHTAHDRQYPFAWLGILAKAAPTQDELVYAHHERGFALYSMRSPEVTRLYLQVPVDTDADDWSDARIWDELHERLGTEINEGPLLEKGVTGMRSFVTEPMRHGKLFLAGDAAHIVPPTGAKGMNLAIADVRVLADALTTHLHDGDDTGIDGYSDTCLRRVWRAEHFSWWMTSMLHTDPAADAFDRRLQLSQLRQTVSSRAAATTLAENYVGLPHGSV